MGGGRCKFEMSRLLAVRGVSLSPRSFFKEIFCVDSFDAPMTRVAVSTGAHVM